MYFLLNFCKDNQFDYIAINVSSIEKLFDLASDILDSRDLYLFLFLDGTQIDDNEYLKTLRSWTQLLVCTSEQNQKIFNLLRREKTSGYIMSISVDVFMLVGKNWLKNYYNRSFEQFNSCCGVCWCCLRKKSILDEFEKKEFYTFNSHVNC